MNGPEVVALAAQLDELVVLVSVLPFEHAFLLLARLAAALWHVRDDASAQVELVRRFEWPEMADAVAAAVVSHEARGGRLVVFAEQYVVALARLLIEHITESSILSLCGPRIFEDRALRHANLGGQSVLVKDALARRVDTLRGIFCNGYHCHGQEHGGH